MSICAYLLNQMCIDTYIFIQTFVCMYMHVRLHVYMHNFDQLASVDKKHDSLHLPINGLGDKFSTSTSAPWWWIKLPQLLSTHRHVAWLEGHTAFPFGSFW